MSDNKVNKWENGKVQKTKMQTIVGKAEYLNPNTGEIEEFSVIEKNISKDFNFHKIWLQDVLNILDSFGNKKILVLTYLLKIMRNEDNSFSGTYRDIADACGVSLPTVSLVMKELKESNVIKQITTATYHFNPSIIIRGSSVKRKNLLIKYNYQEDTKKEVHNAKNVDLDIHPNQGAFDFDNETDPYKLPEP